MFELLSLIQQTTTFLNWQPSFTLNFTFLWNFRRQEHETLFEFICCTVKNYLKHVTRARVEVWSTEHNICTFFLFSINYFSWTLLWISYELDEKWRKVSEMYSTESILFLFLFPSHICWYIVVNYLKSSSLPPSRSLPLLWSMQWLDDRQQKFRSK